MSGDQTFPVEPTAVPSQGVPREEVFWVPDFIDPGEVDSTSLEASRTWGSDIPAESSEPLPTRGNHADNRVGSGWKKQANSAAAKPGGTGERWAGKSSGSTFSDAKKSRGKKPRRQRSWQEKREAAERRAAARQQAQDEAREADPEGFARETALSYLEKMPRSRAQVMTRLVERGVDEATANNVLDRLEAVHLIDDEALAGMIVRSQIASRGLARRALTQELQKRGLEAETTQAALADIDTEAEFERAVALAEKKMRSMSRLDVDTQRRRLAGFLARKGYPPSIVWPVVKHVTQEPPEDDSSGEVPFDEV